MTDTRKYFEDIAIGERRDCGGKVVTKEEIVAFATEYDPQSFHIDEAAAKTSIYGGLIASGWHTGAMVMRLMVDNFVSNVASVGSPGFDNLRWVKPVRPGDTLHVRSECIEKIESKSRPTIGIVKFKNETYNQKGETVMTMTAIGLYLRRPKDKTAKGEVMGEYVTLKAEDGHGFPAYVARPEGKARGGVVVIQEIFGVNAHIKQVTDGFAKDGYLAVAPDMFHRVQQGVDLGYTQEEVTKGREIAMKAAGENLLRDAEAARAYAASAGKVGIVGYCMGGSVVWSAAAHGKFDCAVGYYGGRILENAALKPRCPTLLHFGEKDAGIPIDKVRPFIAQHPEVESHIYAADHGFNCDHRHHYDAAAAKRARERTIGHFRRHLG